MFTRIGYRLFILLATPASLHAGLSSSIKKPELESEGQTTKQTIRCYICSEPIQETFINSKIGIPVFSKDTNARRKQPGNTDANV